MSIPDLTKPQGDPKAWARRIIAQHEAGKPVRPIVLRFAREALKQPKENNDGR